MKHSARNLVLILIVTCQCLIQAYSQTQTASLRPGEQLLWRRVSPTVQQPDGPVLYQIIFRSNAAPNHIPKISISHTLVDSLLTDNGSQVAVSGLAIGSSGVISFANGQSFPGTVSSI